MFKQTTIALAAALTLSLAPVQGQDFASVRRAKAAVQAPAPSVVLHGIMVSNETWTSNEEAGVYALEAKPDGKVTLLHRNSAMLNIAAAVLKDNTLYAVEATMSGFFYSQFSASTWAQTGSRQEIDIVNLPSDLTYDPVTGKVYGGFWDEDYYGYSRFASFSLTTAEASDIKDPRRDERDIFAIAADGKGTIYALFGAFDYLATFDPKTGSAERIGKTGLNPVSNNYLGHVSSMCYDEVNDKLYAAVYQEDGYGESKKCYSGLYDIDLKTGEAQLLYLFDGNACFAGLYVADNQPAATAPAAPKNLNVSVAEGNVNGTVEFDAPTTSVGGAPLTGSLIAVVAVNGVETAVGEIAPGSHVSVPVVLQDGENTIKVTMCDAENRGESASVEIWAGEDMPSPVTDVQLEVADGVATLMWTEPTVGANGGVISKANLYYHITRYPDKKVVATNAKGNTFTDATIDTSWKALYYEVKACNSKGEAAAVASNKCMAGGALTVPFTESFDTADDFDLWTVINSNGGSTWSYNTSNKAAQYEYDSERLPGDDWLISPPIKLEAGKNYKLSYAYRVMMSSYPEKFEMMLGKTPTPEGLTQRLATHTIRNTKLETSSTSFAVDETGLYYIGAHNISDSWMYIMLLDDICIESLDGYIPAAVVDPVVIPGVNGALTATIKFKAPDKTIDGSALASLGKITVTRNGKSEPVATLAQPAVGAELTVVDDDITDSAVYTYLIVCENEMGQSVPATVSAFIGVDVPAAVQNLELVELDRHPVLSWDAPVAGANGGYFNAENMTYRIVRSDGKVVAEANETTTFTDMTYTSPEKAQDALWYLLTPYVGEAKGLYAQSELVLFGVPYTTPAAETFPNADMNYYPWISQSSSAVYYAWTLDTAGQNPQTADQNGDRGVATFHAVGEPVGVESWFYSPKFDIKGLNTPTLGFWMYHSPSIEGDGSIEVYAATGDTFVSTGEVFRRDDAVVDSWQWHTLSLSDFANGDWVRVAFKGTGDGAANIMLDNITIDSPLAVDVALTAFSGPVKIAQGVAADYEVSLFNAGAEAVSKIVVFIADSNGTSLASKEIANIASGEIVKENLSITFATIGKVSLTATVQVEGDLNTENNSATVSVDVVTPVVARPVSLSVVSDGLGGATLTWEAPSTKGAIVDDVESYPAWAIDGIGEWTMFDGDYDLTYYISYTAGEYPNCTSRKAFQVLDMAALGVDIWDEGKAHSGNKLFAALAGINYVNNDWLISPQLNGAEQWISFYARSFTLDDTPAERMRVWYSTTDTDPANFTEITQNYVELGAQWRQYRYYVPEGAKFFAINCVSDGAFAMFVDDIEYNDLSVPSWQLTGYQVLRDGQLIAETDEPYYNDTTLSGTAKVTYTVKAVYGDNGVSAQSDAVEFTASGISSTSVMPVVTSAYTVDGRMVDHKELAPGIYILRYSDGTARKVFID